MMSSEASTEPSAQIQPPSDALQPWQLFTLAGLLGATVVVFMSRGQSPPGIVLLSLTIFAAALVGLGAWRTLAPFSGDDQALGPQTVAGRTRAALERDKALVLRAIKDLEFDRAMGKMSEKDFAEMGLRLRMRAAGLIRQLDAGAGYREQIDRELARRVGSDPGARTPEGAAAAPCPACTTVNDVDARFCKGCGAALEKT